MSDAKISDATGVVDSVTGWYRVGVQLPGGGYGTAAYDENRPQDRAAAIELAAERALEKQLGNS